MSMFGGFSSSHLSRLHDELDQTARHKPQDTRSEIPELEERLDKLQLVCMAMWEVIKEKTDMTEVDLMTKVQEIDLRDGVVDGKVTRTVKDCPQCNRRMSPRHKRCLYCGHEELVVSAFDGI
jgi:ribosomal protein S27AE